MSIEQNIIVLKRPKPIGLVEERHSAIATPQKSLLSINDQLFPSKQMMDFRLHPHPYSEPLQKTKNTFLRRLRFYSHNNEWEWRMNNVLLLWGTLSSTKCENKLNFAWLWRAPRRYKWLITWTQPNDRAGVVNLRVRNHRLYKLLSLRVETLVAKLLGHCYSAVGCEERQSCFACRASKKVIGT